MKFDWPATAPEMSPPTLLATIELLMVRVGPPKNPPPLVAVLPTIVLSLIVPLLAFDSIGYRLGYGGGFYDRTLAKLRARGPVHAIGYAYAGQEVDAVPRESYDQPLDWLATEESLRPGGRQR